MDKREKEAYKEIRKNDSVLWSFFVNVSPLILFFIGAFTGYISGIQKQEMKIKKLHNVIKEQSLTMELNDLCGEVDCGKFYWEKIND